jgi:hypothetical protein
MRHICPYKAICHRQFVRHTFISGRSVHIYEFVIVSLFLVDVLMMDSTLIENYNYLAALGEDPSLTSASFIFCALGEHVVVGFLGSIFLQREQS